MPLKILLVGSNPSHKATSNEAFTADTVSGRILRSWIEGIEGEFVFENLSSQKTENNRPLNRSERALAQVSLQKRIQGTNPGRIVALGKVAAEVLGALGVSFLEMPHPSGLNRKLNDKEYMARKLEELRSFCR